MFAWIFYVKSSNGYVKSIVRKRMNGWFDGHNFECTAPTTNNCASCPAPAESPSFYLWSTVCISKRKRIVARRSSIRTPMWKLKSPEPIFRPALPIFLPISVTALSFCRVGAYAWQTGNGVSHPFPFRIALLGLAFVCSWWQVTNASSLHFWAQNELQNASARVFF